MDRDAGGINADYSDEEFLLLQRDLLKSVLRGLSYVLPLSPHPPGRPHGTLLCHARREPVGEKLADLALLSYPPTEGPTPRRAVVFTIPRGKTKSEKKQFMGSLCHRDRPTIVLSRSYGAVFLCAVVSRRREPTKL